MRAKTQSDQVPGTKVMRLIMCLVLGTLSLGTYAQEAFYIYRNDGDFNGFFYDEVVEMRQSKIGVDSVEYDKWVTQEVVLADTIYRIPLAAIDSIGFQQPEIKFNPRVKFMEQEGLCPYVDYASEFGVTFVNLPAHLKPQIGDVLIGLPTDDIAKEKYDEGSFSCIVDDLYTDGDVTYVSGHAIEQLSDVFEQYITVEQIGVTKDGQVVRRIAGCTPEGFPRAKIKQVSGDAELTLINFESTFTRSWNPTDNSAIELSAQIGLVVKFRAAFNVTWTRFMASLSQDMVIKTKPALAMSVSQGFEFDSGELLPCDEILFPAACPIFGINPIPSLFLRGEGKLEAKLNMPQVRLGVGQHYTIDSNSWFPVSLGLHLVPDENKEVPADMLDLSGQVAFSGYVQTGMKFSGDIFTASWIKKIFRFALGTYLYAGPKVSGEFVVSADIPTEEGQESEGASLYETLKRSQLNVALLSLDLEAKGHFSVFSKEGEKKFFDKNWSFLTDTVVLAPRLESLDLLMVDENKARLWFNVGKGHTLGYCWAEIGIFESLYDKDPLEKLGSFDITRVTEQQAKEGYFVVCPLDNKKAKTYFAVAIIHVGGFGEYRIGGTHILVPPTLSIANKKLHFDCTGKQEKRVQFTTNCADVNQLNLLGDFCYEYDPAKVMDTIDAKSGIYTLPVKVGPNLSLFTDIHVSEKDTNDYFVPHIFVYGDYPHPKTEYLDISIDKNDLSNVSLFAVAGGVFSYGGESTVQYASYDGNVTATRNGEGIIEITGSDTFTNTRGYEEIHNVSIQLQKADYNSDYRDYNSVLSGEITKIEKTSHGNITTSIRFSNVQVTAYGNGYNYIQINPGDVVSGSFSEPVWINDQQGYVTRTYTFVPTSNPITDRYVGLHGNITVKIRSNE